MLLPKMLRRLLEGKTTFYTGSLEDQARTFRQGKGRSASVASAASWRSSPARHRTSSWTQKEQDHESGNTLIHARAGKAETKKKENVVIGFFLHTPFPSSEIFRRVTGLILPVSGWWLQPMNRRILPVRKEILLGVLSCDLIGFHTYDYARHFLSSCTRILGLPTMPNGQSGL